MSGKRLYLDPKLDLGGLAQAVETSPQNLSAALNNSLGKSFYEYLTSLRVEEARRLLEDSSQQHLSLEAVGGDSGFKSRSNFYSAFKEALGETPGEYRKSRSA